MNIKQVYENFQGFTDDNSEKDFDSAVGSFLSTYDNAKSRSAYQQVLSKFESFLLVEGLEFWEIKTTAAYKFQRMCKAGFDTENTQYQPNDAASVNNATTKLKAFYKHIISLTQEHEYRGHDKIKPVLFNSFAGIKKLPITREPESALTIDDIIFAYKSVKYDKIKTAILLCAFAGLRASEPSKIEITKIKVHYGSSDVLETFTSVKNINKYKIWTFHISASKMAQTRNTLFILPILLHNKADSIIDIINSLFQVTYSDKIVHTIKVDGKKMSLRPLSMRTNVKRQKFSIKKVALNKTYPVSLWEILPETFLTIFLSMDKESLAKTLDICLKKVERELYYYNIFNMFMTDFIKFTNKHRKKIYPYKMTTMYLRSANSRHIKPAFKVAGREANFHFHALRHFYATYLSKKGVPIENIKLYLGHASIATTAIYINKTFSEAVAEDIEKLL